MLIRVIPKKMYTKINYIRLLTNEILIFQMKTYKSTADPY